MSDDDLRRKLTEAAARWEHIADNRSRTDRDDAGAWAFRCAVTELRALLAAHPVASPAGQDEGAAEGWAVNAQYHDPLIPGAPVLAWPGSREGSPLVTRTRSEVWTISGIRVVSVEGYAGGIALSHIDVMPTRPAPAVDEEAEA